MSDFLASAAIAREIANAASEPVMPLPVAAGAGQSIADRAPIVVAKKTLLAQWKEQVAAMRAAAPRGKLGETVSVMYCEVESFLEWVGNLGGENGATLFICAKVYKRATLETIGAELNLNPALLWAFVNENDDRFAHYRRAQAGIADGLVSSVPAILDGAWEQVRGPDGEPVLDAEGKLVYVRSDVKRDKVRGDGYLQVARMLHPERFGTREQAASPATGNVIDAALNFAAAELLNRIARPVPARVIEHDASE